MDRYTQGETVTLVAKLPDNAIGTVVSVWKLDGTLVVVDQPCQQIIISIFIYSFQPTEEATYVWQMKGTHPVTLKLHTWEDSFFYGGWVDSLLKPEHLELLAKENTVLTRTTPQDLELLAKEATSQNIKIKTDSLVPGQTIVYLSKGLKVESHSVTDFYLGKSATIVASVTFDTLPISGATVTGDYYKPDNTVFLSNQSFTEIGTTGVYVHTFDIPIDAAEGVYKVKIKAAKTSGGGVSYSEDFTGFVPADWGSTGGTYAVYNESGNDVYRKTDYGGFMFAYSIAGGNRADFTYSAKVRMDSQLPGGANAASDYVGIAFRYANSSQTYDFYFRKGGGNVRLRKNGATLAETAPDYGNPWLSSQWYTMKVVVTGGNIKCYVDDELQIEYNDTTPLSAGMVGLFTYNSVGSWDDISIETTGVTTESYVARDFKAETDKVQFLKDIEEGRWQILNNQMIFCKADNTTEIMKFDLYNKAGQKADENIFDRKRV